MFLHVLTSKLLRTYSFMWGQGWSTFSVKRTPPLALQPTGLHIHNSYFSSALRMYRYTLQHNRQLLTVKICIRQVTMLKNYSNFSKISMFLEFFACIIIIIIIIRSVYCLISCNIFSCVVLASELFMYIHMRCNTRMGYGTGGLIMACHNLSPPGIGYCPGSVIV